jgi:CheY-like chemotaxis protein
VDVLICDLAMPDMTGFEVVQEIRAREATLGRRTPAVALSAHASEANVERCRRAGFDRHLAKPFDTGTLARIVAELVSR